MSADANEALQSYIFNHCVHVDGNGRFIRNMVEQLIRIQSDRVFFDQDDRLLTIIEADIDTFINTSA